MQIDGCRQVNARRDAQRDPNQRSVTRATVLMFNRSSGPATLRPELCLFEQAMAPAGLL